MSRGAGVSWGWRIWRAASLWDSNTDEPWRLPTVEIRSSGFGLRRGQRLVGEAYHWVFTVDAREGLFFTHRRVVMVLCRKDRTRTDCATCAAWLSGAVARLSISQVK